MMEFCETRRNRLSERAAEAGIDALMVSDPLNLLYFTGIKITPYERFIAFLLDIRTGQGQLILPSLEKDTAKDAGVGVKLYSDQDDPYALVLDLIGAYRQVGVEKEYLSLAAAEKIAAGLNGETGTATTTLADISEITAGARRRKDDVELDHLRRAARLSDGILEEVAGKIQKGQTEREVVFAMMSAMVAQPQLLTDQFVILALAGPGSADPHGHPGNRVIGQGAPILIDFGVCHQHYWSDCTRTFFLGQPEPQLKKIYEIVLEAQEAAIAAVRPGVSMADIDLTARKVIERAGYGQHFIHRVGHGIGLAIHEPPSVHSRNLGLLEEGMVITIEPGIYLPGIGGVRIEDDVAVTARGVEVLTHYPKSVAKMVL